MTDGCSPSPLTNMAAGLQTFKVFGQADIDGNFLTDFFWKETKQQEKHIIFQHYAHHEAPEAQL